jgi:Kdo2-lipid IVA lauroyltransferase/acyltransferase
MRNTIDYLLYLILRCVIASIQAISIERCSRWSQLLASLLHHVVRLRRGLVEENLQRVFPEWSAARRSQTAHRMWHHLLLMVCEIAQARRKIHRTNWHHFFRFSDRATLLRQIIDDRPKMMVTGHFGNFELGGFVNGLFGMPATTLARPLDNHYIHKFITDFRSTGGQHFLSKDHSANEIQKLLEAGGTLSLLADQDAGLRGCWANFLGHPASCHKAIALFTLVNGASMIVLACHRRRKPMSFEIVLHGIADPEKLLPEQSSVQTLTQWYNDQLEKSIRAEPDQYWWLHRRWRELPARLQKQSKKAIDESARLAS